MGNQKSSEEYTAPKSNIWDICPIAEDSATIAYRLACDGAKDSEIFNKFCLGNYQNCPKREN